MKKLSVWKMGKPYIGFIILGSLCMFAATVLELLFPLVTKSIVDDVILGGRSELLIRLLAAILGIGIFSGLFHYAKEYTFDRVGCAVASDVRRTLFTHIQGLSMDYFDNTNTGELMARIKEDADMMWDAFGMTGMLTIQVTVHVIVVVYCMLTQNALLTVFPVSVMLIMAVLAIYMESKLDKVFGDISEKNAELTTVAEENISGVRTVKAFVREDYEIEKFRKKNTEYCDLNMKMTKILVRIYPYFELVGKILPVMTAILGGFLVAREEMTIGTLVAFVEYSRNIVWPCEVIGELANEISAIHASYKKINKVMEQEPTIFNKEEPVILPEVKGEITFEHVDFEREGHDVLKDVSFTVPAGRTLGIMGETGAGKSSVIRLMGRLFDVTGGSVKLDGVDVRDLTLKQVRGSIAPVMQEVFLFSDTVQDNIRMGDKEHISRGEVVKAAKKAKAHNFILEMDKNYETIIGERGVGLSGGQKQRISIARALTRKCPILIFDDATSALDMETEREIQKELKELAGITKIIVGHRISAVRYADEIIVLEKGSIVERGTHEELLQLKGRYYETYCSQYGEESMSA